MKTKIKSTYRLIRKNWVRLLALEFAYKFIFFFLIIPFGSLLLNGAIKLTKYSYITTENFLSFMLYPHTILFLLIAIVVLVLFLQMESASLLYFFEDCKNKKKHNVAQLLVAGIKSTSSLIRRKCFMVPVHTVIISFFLNLPLMMIVIAKSVIPSYVLNAIFDLKYMDKIIYCVLFLLLILAYRRIFVLPLCILDKKGYKEAKKEAIENMKGKNISIMIQLVFVNFILAIFYYIAYAICIGLLILGINLLAKKEYAIPMFLQNYEQLNRIILVCISILGSVVNYSLISNLFVRESEPNIQEIVYKKKEKQEFAVLQKSVKRQLKKCVVVMMCLCAITTYSYFYNVLKNGSFSAEASLLGLQISAHRGFSEIAPENTIPALQKAIDSLVDYAEIDVQLTKDGEVVLCHDSNLYRTCGVKAKVSKLTYDQLMEYDVGVKFSKEYAGTRIPTLREVLHLCKGKIKLNIEIKRIQKQRELVEKVVDIIEEYDFERQCVISSMSYDALKMVKQRNEDIKTGYIMSIGFGNFYKNKNIDFFSMKNTIVTEDIVEKAHKLGKEVHVWTVNTKNEVTRLKALGVDNLITDRPVYVQEIIYDTKNTSLLQYIKALLK